MLRTNNAVAVGGEAVQLLERAIERNAYLGVALRHVVAELHTTHADRAHPWQRCREASCSRAALALGERRSA
jgi:hypothetical protein